MRMKKLDDLLLEQLQDLYGAEQQLVKALPKMAKAASSEQLQDAFQEHLDQTRHQRRRLEQVFESIGQKPKARKCKGMQGIIEEGEELLQMDGDPAVRDAGLIGAAQKVEHYEIATYGTIRALARRLGHEDVANLLQETLDEEGETDHKLTELAESQVNPAAASAAREPSQRSSRQPKGRRGARR